MSSSTTRCFLHESDYKVVSIVVRLGLIGWGLLTIFPSMMMTDAGTDLAIATAKTLLWSSAFFILAGIFGCWSLLVAAVVAMLSAFVALPDGIHLTILRIMVPIALVLCSILALFEWCGWLPLKVKRFLGQATTTLNDDNDDEAMVTDQPYATHYVEATEIREPVFV